MVYNKDPMLVLWDIVKTLGIATYKDVMTDDENNIPNSYILLRADINNNGKVYGDGATKVRTSDCDIMLISKGAHPNTTDLHNTNKMLIDAKLKELGIFYKFIHIGYASASNTTTSTWTLPVNTI